MKISIYTLVICALAGIFCLTSVSGAHEPGKDIEIFRRSLYAVNLTRDTVQLFDNCDSVRFTFALLVDRNSCSSCVAELGSFIDQLVISDESVTSILLMHGYDSSLERRRISNEFGTDTLLQDWPVLFDVDSPMYIRKRADEAADIHGRLGINGGPALILWNCDQPEASQIMNAASLFASDGTLSPAARESIIRLLTRN